MLFQFVLRSYQIVPIIHNASKIVSTLKLRREFQQKQKHQEEADELTTRIHFTIVISALNLITFLLAAVEALQYYAQALHELEDNKSCVSRGDFRSDLGVGLTYPFKYQPWNLLQWNSEEILNVVIVFSLVYTAILSRRFGENGWISFKNLPFTPFQLLCSSNILFFVNMGYTKTYRNAFFENTRIGRGITKLIKLKKRLFRKENDENESD